MSAPAVIVPSGFAGLLIEPLRARRRVDPDASVTILAGVGPKVAERLGRLGLRTVRDVAEYLPRAFLDWREATGFRELAFGQSATVECTVERVSLRPTRRRNLKIVEAILADRHGGRAAGIWFNQAWLADRLTPGTHLLVHGELTPGRGCRASRSSGTSSPTTSAGAKTRGLVPLYAASQEVSTLKLLELTGAALAVARFFPDPLPAAVRAREALPLRADALHAAHRPGTREDFEVARDRLALEELVVLLVGLLRRRREFESAATAPALGEPGELLLRYRATLPFELHARAGRGDRRARSRPRCRATDATSPPGRRRARGRPWSPSMRSCAPLSAGTRAR